MILLLWSLRAAAVIVLGGLIAVALRQRSAATRTVVLRATLLAAWLIPLVTLVAPAIEVRLPEPPPAAVAEAKLGESALMTGQTVKAEDFHASSKVSASDIAPSPQIPWVEPTFVDTAPPPPFPWPGVVYGVGGSLLVFRWLVGYGKLLGLLRRATSIRNNVFRAKDDSLGVPVTFGLFRPKILLPLASEGWPESRVEAAILHEQAHIGRRDWGWQSFAGLFAAIHWANPAAWLLVRALRDTAEAAADDAVLAAGITPSLYARELLEVARTARSTGSATAMARRGGVSDRVALILARNRDRSRPTWRLTLVTAAGLAVSALAVAGIRAAATSATGFKVDPRLAARSRDAAGNQVRLKDGRTVELRMVERYESGKLVRWRPDGTVQDTQVGDSALKSFVRFTEKSPHPQMGLQLFVKGGVVRDGYERFVTSYPVGATTSDHYPESKGDLIHLALLGTLDDGTKTASFHAGFASGPWHVYQRSVPFATKKTSSGLTIQISEPKELEWEQCSVAGYGRSGKEFKSIYPAGTMTNADGKKVLYAALQGQSSQDVARVELRYRTLDWVRFADVPLKPTRMSGDVLLADLREVNPFPSPRWDALGEPVATPDDVTKTSEIPGLEGHHPNGRQLEVRFGIEGCDPGDDFNAEAKSPAEITYWLPQAQKTLNVALFVPNGVSSTDLKVGRATGAWQKAVIKPTDFLVLKALPAIDTKRISVRIPKSIETDQTKIRSFDATGKEIGTEAIGFEISKGYRASLGLIRQKSAAVARVELWHRPYVWKSFPKVPLRPTSMPQAIGPQKLASGRVVELAGLQERDKSWDGNGKPVNFPNHEFSFSSIRQGWRRMAVGIRMTGSDFADLPVRVTAWSKYAYPSGDVVWQDLPGKPHEKIAWCSLQIRPDVKTANLGVDLYSGPWRKDAEAVPGKGAVVTPGRITQLGNRKVQEYSVGLEGFEIPGQDRYCELTVYSDKGYFATLVQAIAFGPGGTYTVFLPVGQKVSKVVLRSRALEHVRFSGVKMWPG